MSLRVSNLSIPVEAGDGVLPVRLAEILGLSAGEVGAPRILRKSLDLRNKKSLKFVYSAEVVPPADWKPKRDYAHLAYSVEPYSEVPFEVPPPGNRDLVERPVVIGSGPAGLIAAYFLAEQGYRPLVLERGTRVTERIKDVKEFDSGGKFEPESNYLFGEGGAGTFSDGKLTCRGSGPDVDRVLRLFAECKGKPSVMYEHRPHLGSNRLPAVVKAIRRRIEAMGGEVRFGCRMTDIAYADGQVKAIETDAGTIPTNAAILATGHSARDVYELAVKRGIPIEAKPFQMGVRVEHPQETVNRVQFGGIRYETILGNADYSLVARGNADLFTFCMCAGGYIIPSVSQEGYFCTNGMSLSKRDAASANSGLVVTIPISEFGAGDPLAGVRLQQTYERKAYELGQGEYACPAQRASDFLANRKTANKFDLSYPRGTLSANLREVLPDFVIEALMNGLPRMDRAWHGRFLPEAVLVGPESRGSSPVRIVRDSATRESPGIDGLFPAGEGAGYAGGIVSAAVDGLRTAKAIVAKYRVPR